MKKQEWPDWVLTFSRGCEWRGAYLHRANFPGGTAAGMYGPQVFRAVLDPTHDAWRGPSLKFAFGGRSPGWRIVLPHVPWRWVHRRRWGWLLSLHYASARFWRRQDGRHPCVKR